MTPLVSVAPGTVVLDDHKRLGIVAEKRPQPSAAWLAEQRHPVSEAHVGAQWWAVMPLTGGLILSPEPLLQPLRRASYEDFTEAVEGANEHGRRSLATLFPEYVQRALGKAASRGGERG